LIRLLFGYHDCDKETTIDWCERVIWSILFSIFLSVGGALAFSHRGGAITERNILGLVCMLSLVLGGIIIVKDVRKKRKDNKCSNDVSQAKR